jgi:type I restriction enzyme R subunit
MYQSIHEGFTLDVLQNYTTYKRYFKVKEKSGQDIEVPSNKAKKALVKYVDSEPETIREKSAIILDHFIKNGSKEIQGTARGMVVVRSRDHCVKYFREINSQLEDRVIKYRALVAFSDKIEEQTEMDLNQTIGHDRKVLIEDGLKNPKYRLLIVSDKFQTGFNEPLVQSMYVDKKLGGAQCVQTLSRLNRTKSGKDKTFILDFVNELIDIVESFQPYYTTTVLEGETDPDQLYEFQNDINSFNLFTPVDVDEFCKIFYEVNRDDGRLQPILNQTVDHFNQIEDDKKKEEFKSHIKAFMKLYSYVSQIMTFTDVDIEKLFIFLRFLNKKLPKKESEQLDISDSVDMDSLRIQKMFEGKGDLNKDDSTLEPTVFGVGQTSEEVRDLLSEIIKEVNEKFGSTLTDDDKIDLGNLDKKLMENEKLREYWNGDNSESNKNKIFKDTIDDIMLSYVNDRFDFYKKMEDKNVYNYVIRTLRENYKKNISKL